MAMTRHASALAIVIALLAAGPAGATLPSGNLVRNPGAEDGRAAVDSVHNFTPPGWSTVDMFSPNPTAVRYGTPGGFPSTSVSTAIGGDESFFAGGPATGSNVYKNTAVLHQVVALPPSAFPDIDAGSAVATVSGCLGGYGAQDDSSSVWAFFFDGSDQQVGKDVAVFGPTASERGDQTALLPRVSSGAVVPGVRSVAVEIYFRQPNGSSGYNDGYADNVSFTLTPAGAPTPPANCPPAPTGGGGGGGDAGSGDPGGMPPAASPFSVSAASSTARFTRSGVGVSLACAAQTSACAGTVALTLPSIPRASSVRLGSQAFSIAPGQTQTIRVRLGRSAKKRLSRLSSRQLRRLRPTAKVTMGAATSSFTLRLKR
jgi:hypothetical protein